MGREKITTEFLSPRDLDSEVEKYKEGKSPDIYARSGYPELEKREKEFAKMIGAPDAALFNSGMAAIHTAIEAEGLKPGDIVLCGKDVYSQTKKMFKSLSERGIKIEFVDSGNMEEIEKEIKKRKPRLIILETVANAEEMQVCDVKKLAEITEQENKLYKEKYARGALVEKYFSLPEIKGKNNKKIAKLFSSEEAFSKFKDNFELCIKEFQAGNNPFVFRSVFRDITNLGLSKTEAVREISNIVRYVINNSREKLSLILDNSLASPVLRNPLKEIGECDIEAVIAESATKHYQEGEDKITLGITYSNKEEKIKDIKATRGKLGTYLQPTAEKEIPEDITEKMPDILKRHAKNAFELAKFLDEINSEEIIEVSHPNLSKHKQNELAQKIAPEGLVSLFYIKVKDPVDFVEKVKKAGGDKIGIGSSFGHKKTWLFNLDKLGKSDVRIAAGSESEEEFKEVLKIFSNVLKK